MFSSFLWYHILITAVTYVWLNLYTYFDDFVLIICSLFLSWLFMGQLYSYLCLNVILLYCYETISICIYVLVCKWFLMYNVNKVMHDCKDPIIPVSRINMISYRYHHYFETRRDDRKFNDDISAIKLSQKMEELHFRINICIPSSIIYKY